MPPARSGDLDASDDTAVNISSRKLYFDELPLDAFLLSSSQGGQDRDISSVLPCRSRRPRRSLGSSKENVVITPLSKQRKKSKSRKSRNPGSQSSAKPIAIKGAHLQPTVVFDTFWRFAAERKAVDDRRRAGLPQP